MVLSPKENKQLKEAGSKEVCNFDRIGSSIWLERREVQSRGFLGSVNGRGCGDIPRWVDPGLLAQVWLSTSTKKAESSRAPRKGKELSRGWIREPVAPVLIVRISAFTLSEMGSTGRIWAEEWALDVISTGSFCCCIESSLAGGSGGGAGWKQGMKFKRCLKVF